ncbi:hypothetical protein ACJX0J_007554, partial [Zea mays]
NKWGRDYFGLKTLFKKQEEEEDITLAPEGTTAPKGALIVHAYAPRVTLYFPMGWSTIAANAANFNLKKTHDVICQEPQSQEETAQRNIKLWGGLSVRPFTLLFSFDGIFRVSLLRITIVCGERVEALLKMQSIVRSKNL